LPQGHCYIAIRSAPKRPVTPRRLLRLAYSGPPLVKTPADVMAIIRARCADVLTEAELALVLKLPALEGPAKVKVQPKAKAIKPQPTKPKRKRDAMGRYIAR